MPTKRCYRCKQLKPVGDFAANSKRRDGHTVMCNACKKVYNAANYERTKDRHNPARIERTRRARAEAAANVIAYLRNHPCVDCGEADIVVLDFDHQADKVAEINDMIHAGAKWPAILAEIAKCEVVCSNDHRRRTAAAFGWRRAVTTSLVSSTVEQRTLNP